MHFKLKSKILNSIHIHRLKHLFFHLIYQKTFKLLKKSNKTKGFTLIELLISMCLGSLVLFAAISFQSHSFKHYLQGHDQLDTNQSKQSIMQQLKKIIGNAGYLAEYPAVPEWNKICFAAINKFSDESVVYGVDRSMSSSQSDDLLIHFFGNAEGTVQDCRGVSIKENQRAEIRFYVDNAESQLVCDSQVYQRDATGDAMCSAPEKLISSAQKIVIGNKIKSFQVLYGLPVNTDNYRWVNASNLGASSTYMWKDITAIQIGMISEFGKNYLKQVDATLFSEKMIAKPGEVLRAEKTTVSLRKQSF
ncbi:MAG: PilW family protein [Pseudomonadota bacterium]